MYDKIVYTPGMRDVVIRSKAEASRLGHDYIGPEHYLLGIISKGDGLAAQTLINFKINFEDLKAEVERMLDIRKGSKLMRYFRFIPNNGPNDQARNVLAASKAVAISLKCNWIGTEFLILALLKVEGTIADRCLRLFGLDYEKTEREVWRVLYPPDGSG
jgi:ATP-dependent Clp protease ATP-binding subunit ClpC